MKTMKRVAMLVMAMIMLAGTANAKIATFGIKAGLNVNKLHFNQEVVNDLRNSTGWEAGVMAEFNVPIIGIAADISLMYARMNNTTLGELENSMDYVNGKVAGKNFIMLPINLKYKFNLPVVSKYIVPYIFTGPDFAFKLDKNVFDNIKSHKCQVAWNVGLGIELINHLQIGASYGFGITNIMDKVKLVNGQDLNIKNNYWTVTAAWLF